MVIFGQQAVEGTRSVTARHHQVEPPAFSEGLLNQTGRLFGRSSIQRVEVRVDPNISR